MDFYNEAVKAAKEQNVEISDTFKELILAVSYTVQNMSLKEQSDFFKTLIDRWELN